MSRLKDKSIIELKEGEKQQIIQSFLNFDINNLDRTADFGNKNLDWEKIKKIFQDSRNYLKRFIDQEQFQIKSSFSQKIKDQILEYIQSTWKNGVNILELDKLNNKEEGNQLIKAREGFQNTTEQRLAKFEARLFPQQEELQEITKQSKELKRTLETMAKEAKQTAKKLQTYEQEGSQSAAIAGSHELFSTFEQKEKTSRKSSKLWLLATIILIGFILCVTLYYDGTFTIKEPTQFAKKILLITVLGTATKFSANNYISHKHLEEVNGFRARVINTIARITENKDWPEEIKKEFLINSGQAVFNLHNSSYLKNTKDTDSKININSSFPKDFMNGQ